VLGGAFSEQVTEITESQRAFLGVPVIAPVKDAGR
jgi:hypothetical protein